MPLKNKWSDSDPIQFGRSSVSRIDFHSKKSRRLSAWQSYICMTCLTNQLLLKAAKSCIDESLGDPQATHGGIWHRTVDLRRKSSTQSPLQERAVNCSFKPGERPPGFIQFGQCSTFYSLTENYRFWFDFIFSSLERAFSNTAHNFPLTTFSKPSQVAASLPKSVQ